MNKLLFSILFVVVCLVFWSEGQGTEPKQQCKEDDDCQEIQETNVGADKITISTCKDAHMKKMYKACFIAAVNDYGATATDAPKLPKTCKTLSSGQCSTACKNVDNKQYKFLSKNYTLSKSKAYNCNDYCACALLAKP